MKRIFYFIGCLSVAVGCHMGQPNPRAGTPVEPVAENDSVAIRQAYEKLKTDLQFLKELGLEEEKQFRWADDFIFKIYRGDLNHDGDSDALLAFSIEGRGGGNHSDFHYAAFLHQDKGWTYGGQLDAEVMVEDRFFEVQSIQNGIIKGAWVGNKNEDLPSYTANYVVNNGQFYNTYTELHTIENGKQTQLDIYDFITEDFRSIPLSAALKDYEQLLGKGDIETPEEQFDCGTYWDEGNLRYLLYPSFKFELNDQNEAGWMHAYISEQGIVVQTDLGTLSKNTTASELKAIFSGEDQWTANEDGTESLTLMFGDSDDQLVLYFDTNGKLAQIEHRIQC